MYKTIRRLYTAYYMVRKVTNESSKYFFPLDNEHQKSYNYNSFSIYLQQLTFVFI